MFPLHHSLPIWQARRINGRNESGDLFGVPYLLGHGQAGEQLLAQRPVHLDAQAFKNPHQLARMLATVPRGSFKKLMMRLLAIVNIGAGPPRSEEHTSELQSLMRISYAVF